MVSECQIPVPVTIDGKSERAETVLYSAGAYVLALATTLADRVISLHSTYTGDPATGTLSSHLLLAHDAYRAMAGEHEHDALPLTHLRRRLLYDHLQRLQDLLDELGLAATIAVDERAVELIER